MVALPTDWDVMKQGFFDFVRTNVDTTVPVVWGRQDSPQPPKPYVYLTILVPPLPDGQAQNKTLDGTTVVVSTVLPSTMYSFDVGVTTITYTSSATPTDVEIRDGLAADLLVKEPAIVQESLLTNGLRVETALVVDTSGDVNLDCKTAVRAEIPATATFTIDVIGREPEETTPSAETIPILTGLLIDLETPETAAFFCTVGWAFISVEGIRKPDLVAGSKWEDRSGFDVRLRCRISSIKFKDFIETAAIDVGIQGSLT